MKNIFLRTKFIWIVLPIAISFVAVIVNPMRYSQSILDGLKLYVSAVLPTLFPMLIFSGLFIGFKVADGIGAVLKKPCEVLFDTPPISGYILIISMLSGYPVGAKLIADYYRAGLIDANTARRITSFTMTSGPMFIIGTVGGVFFSNVSIGYVILFSHYIGAILNGVIFSRLTKHDKPNAIILPTTDPNNVLYDVFNNGVATIALVGGFIAFFYMLTDMVIDCGILNLTQKLGGQLLSSVTIGLVEMTRGCQMLSTITCIDAKKIIAIATAMISFGGLSVTLQATAFLRSTSVSTLYYLKIKIVQALLSGIVAYFILIFWG